MLIRSVIIALVLASCATPSGRDGDRVVEINLSTKGNDIAFDQAAIELKQGSPVLLRFSNQAAKDSEIAHNIVILRPGAKDSFIKYIQKNSYDTEKVKAHEDVVSMSEVLAPGENGLVRFEAKEAGFYTYICTMPGHGDMLGMVGTIHVK